MAFACNSSGVMTILAGKNDESVVKIISSEDHPICYEEVNGETVDPFKIDADTLEGKSVQDIVNSALAHSVHEYILALSNGWIGPDGTGKYSQTISCSVAKSNMRYEPELRQIPSDGSAFSDNELEAFSLISPIGTCEDGKIILVTAGSDKPSTDIKLLFIGEV